MSDGAVPDLRAAILRRAEQLPEAARALLVATAVASGPLDRNVAVAAAGISAEDEAALLLLKNEHLVRARGVDGRTLLETYHDRIRETVLESLDAEARRAIHERLARALEAWEHADPEALAHHLAGAGDQARAATFAVLAADRAMLTLAFHRAARLYEAALAMMGPRAVERAALEEKRGRAHASSGQCHEAAKAFLDAAALSPPQRARDLRRLAAEMLLQSGRIDEGEQIFRGVLAEHGLRLPTTSALTLASILQHRAVFKLRGLGFKRRAEEEIPADELFRVDLCRSVSVGMVTGAADMFCGVDFQNRYLLAALRAGEPKRLAHALSKELVNYSSQHGTKGAARIDAMTALAAALVDELGDPYLSAHLQLCRAIAQFFYYRFKDALSGIDDAARTLRDRCTGVWADLSQASMFAQNALLALDEWHKLGLRCSEDLIEGEENGDDCMVATCQLHLSRAWLIGDDIERAQGTLAEVRGRWSRRGFQFMHYLMMYNEVNVLLYAGDAEGAYARVRADQSRLRRSLLLSVQSIRVYAQQQHAHVALAMAARGHDVAQQLAMAERDARQLDRDGFSWATARASLIHAGVAHLRGNEDDAVMHLRRAIVRSDDASLGLHAAVARCRLGELLGGAEGAALSQEGTARLRGAGVAVPERLCAFWTPAFSGPV